jgi:hypothetical protein
MARIWNTPFFILATLYFVVDGVFSYVTHPVSAWIAKKKPFQRARNWMSSLRPYPSLATTDTRFVTAPSLIPRLS